MNLFKMCQKEVTEYKNLKIVDTVMNSSVIYTIKRKLPRQMIINSFFLDM